MESYSVLMSVYYKEKPRFLKESIDSMLEQTVLTNDFVLVCDGPLTPELDAVIAEYEQNYPNLFQIIRLEKNLGIGGAANVGISYCKNNLVAKMDSDDIALANRCEMQLTYFEKNPELDIVGSHIIEFKNSIENEISRRKVPLKQSEILKYAKRRMPFNNQTIMYKKSAVEAVGGYSSLKRCEDYELYSRMLMHGCKAENVDDYLVYYRLTDDAYARRGTWQNLKGFVLVRWKIHKMGLSSFSDFLIPTCGQLILTVLPVRLKEKMYEKLLRK